MRDHSQLHSRWGERLLDEKFPKTKPCTSEGKGKGEERAAKSGMDKFVSRALSDSHLQVTDRRYVIWCPIILPPQMMMGDVSYQLHVGRLLPSYARTSMSEDTFKGHLTSSYTEVHVNVMSIICEHVNPAWHLGTGDISAARRWT